MDLLSAENTANPLWLALRQWKKVVAATSQEQMDLISGYQVFLIAQSSSRLVSETVDYTVPFGTFVVKPKASIQQQISAQLQCDNRPIHQRKPGIFQPGSTKDNPTR